MSVGQEHCQKLDLMHCLNRRNLAHWPIKRISWTGQRKSKSFVAVGGFYGGVYKPGFNYRERRRIKKMKKHLLKKQQQLMACCQSTAAVAYEDGSKKKGKCMEDLCKHRRHKKKRKHKRHSQDREAPEEEKAVPSIAESSQESVVMVADNKQQFKVMDNEDTEETMDSCSAGDDPDFRDPVRMWLSD